jgi:hypothetical protein
LPSTPALETVSLAVPAQEGRFRAPERIGDLDDLGEARLSVAAAIMLVTLRKG